ncbi:MAG TPA: archaeosortase/exosortase family protein [Phycisphaerae bacterium]|nr:archaeosortase/exosortase family protein [Phycisphaerae bacterium]HNU45898.1 archaeosortase/exosortase family protein [Phycisphaerae bacterium]
MPGTSPGWGRKHGTPPTPSGSGDHFPRGPERTPRSEHALTGGFRAWWAAKGPVLHFVAVFALLMAVFYGVFYRPMDEKSWGARFVAGHLHRYAVASAAVLRVLGESATVSGQTIGSPRFSVKIVRGCDAMEVTALFVSAVLALPVRWWRKIPGVLVGWAALAIINVVRIVSLYYVGIHFPQAFDAMHYGVWQGVIVILALVLWVLWAWWASRERVRRTHVPA